MPKARGLSPRLAGLIATASDGVNLCLSAIAKKRFALLDEGRHALLLVFGRKHRLEQPALEAHPLAETRLEGPAHRFLGHLDDRLGKGCDALGDFQGFRHEAIVRNEAGDEAGALAAGSLDDGSLATTKGPAVVAVATGPGLVEVFKSLGASQVVAGGQTMNPSTKDLLTAIGKVRAGEVILLPNNANIVMAAQQAQALSGEGKSVVVVPSRSIPQGISALLSLNLHSDLEHNLKVMTAAMEHVQTGEVTTAVQDARFDGIEVHAGDVIGLLNDRLTAKGPTSEDVVKQLLDQMGAADLEVITLYYGQPVTEQGAGALQGELSQAYPNQEIEVINGGQPFYHYIISVE